MDAVLQAAAGWRAPAAGSAGKHVALGWCLSAAAAALMLRGCARHAAASATSAREGRDARAAGEQRQPARGESTGLAGGPGTPASPSSSVGVVPTTEHVTVLHASLTGTAAGFAEQLAAAINDPNFSGACSASVGDLGAYSDAASADIEDKLVQDQVLVFVVATYEGGVAPGRSAGFCRWLSDFANDFRVSKTIFRGVRFAVFGCGNSDYDENFNAAAKGLEAAMLRLGARALTERGDGDDSVHMGIQFAQWQQATLAALCGGGGTDVEGGSSSGRLRAARGTAGGDGGSQHPAVGSRAVIHHRGGVGASAASQVAGDVRLPLKEYRRRKRRAAAAKAEAASRAAAEAAGLSNSSDSAEDSGGSGAEEWVDMEDIGGALAAATRRRQKQASKRAEGGGAKKPPKPMVTARHRAQLTKEGYKIIGSHSAVKLCRWTKAQLRGRGGCYKHTFYGITSYQCMEATPSLSCANKCVFCWRHHKNPVGREWRWEVDQPDMLVRGAIERHQRMIKELRGMPGVIEKRLEEAMTVRHCALSLVGEPIMYPYISEFVQYLHARQISSFLVTNAQFPEALRRLPPVTQLYVSVDAGNKRDLQAVDRPLFADFWERYLLCLDILREKKQRTVYRVTLLKSYNMTCVQEYAELIKRGRPTFVEIKGVTFCGDSKASSMTMANVPFHEEVREFSELVARACNEGENAIAYEPCSEHAHSNCMLLGHPSMKQGGGEAEFATWIDYARFHQLVSSGEPFTAADYSAPTPEWARYRTEYTGKGAGFDPAETRWHRNSGVALSKCHLAVIVIAIGTLD